MLNTQTETTPLTAGILGNAPALYIIVYVSDVARSRAFYEDQLRLRLIEADEASAKFDCGLVILCLQNAADYGITLAGRCDDSSDLVFLVDDINATRAALERNSVTFVRRRTYEIGLVTDFYDPDGHRLMIYQPSAVALSWPSGDKLRQLWRECGRGGSELIGPAAEELLPINGDAHSESGLDGKPLAYLFLFVPESDAALHFYQDDLGLRAIERVHCCNPACPPEEKGIVKYDVGSFLMTTHHVHRSPVVDDFGKIYSPRAVDRAHTQGIAPVFVVQNLQDILARLPRHVTVNSKGIFKSHIGSVVHLVAPTGHTIVLYEPLPYSLQWPSGKKVRNILAALAPIQS